MRPPWVGELLDKYRASVSHVFLLHGNVSDYVEGTVPMRCYLDGLWSAVTARSGMVVRYNRSEGITFGGKTREERDEAKERFLSLVGLGPEDEAYAALRGPVPEDAALPKDPLSALQVVETAMRAEGAKVLFLVEHAESVVPRGEWQLLSPEDRTCVVTFLRWAQDTSVGDAGNVVLLLASSPADVHPSLRSPSARIEAVEVPLPSFEERLETVRSLRDRFAERETPVDFNVSEELFAASTAALSRLHVEDVMLRAYLAGSPVTSDLIRERKREIVAQEFGELLEFMEPSFGFEAIGGLDHVKRFLLEDVVEPIRRGSRDVPMGIGFFGPPGTGKTAVAQALAKESGFNAVCLNLGKLFGPYVGESERNLEKALSAIEALSPVVVFLDEIDQAGVGRGQSGDSGVSNRYFKRLLEFMSDPGHRGRIIFLVASNRPDLLDAALKRPGRLDAKLAFVTPEAGERFEILLALARKHGIELEAPDPDEFAKRTEGFTGAEMEAVLLKAKRVASREGRSPVSRSDLDYALWAISPGTAEVKFQTLIAVREVNDKDLLPERYRRSVSDRTALEREIKALEESDPASGRRVRL